MFYTYKIYAVFNSKLYHELTLNEQIDRNKTNSL